MKYHFKISKEKTGYSAQCIELEGCITQANSKKQLCENMQEALNLYVQEPESSKDLAALPNKSIRKSKNVVEVPLDPSVAFSFLVRHERIKHGWTQEQTANKMGFDKVFMYQRLESKNCNPTLKTIQMVKQTFPKLSLDSACA